MFNILFATFTFLSLLLTSLCINAQPLVLAEKGSYKVAEYVEYLEEKGDKMTIDEILSYDGQWIKNDKDDINFGFNNTPYWFKFNVKNINTAKKEWVLEIAYPVLDNVDLYIVNSHNETIVHYYGSDNIPPSDRVISHPNIVFPIEFSSNEPMTLYIRVQNEGAIQVPLTLWQWEDFSFNTLINFLFQGLFYGMVLIMAIYNTMIWILEKQSVYVSYIIYIICFAVFQLSLHGIGYQFIWGDFPIVNQYITPVSLNMVSFAFLLFIDNFFNLKEINIKLHLFLKYNRILALTLTGLSFLIPYSIIIQLGTYYILIGLFMVITITFYMLKIQHPSARFFVVAWAMFLLGAIFLLGNKLGVFPITTFSQYGAQLGAGLEIMFLSLALADRMANTQKEKILAKEESLQLAYQVNYEKERNYNAELENLRIEREHSQKLESLVEARTEELQSTLSELSNVNEKLKTISVTDGLTGLYNRYYFNENWSKEYKRAHRDKTQLSIVILDVDHFKKINDEFGHPAGDMCLMKIAVCIRRHAARDFDIVCRYGGEEFAIILPNTPAEGALEVSESMRQAIEHLQLIWEGKKISVTASLGVCTHTPLNADDTYRQLMVSQADQALYQAKSQGRNQVVVFKP